MITHPPITEHDTGSWLDGHLSEHDVVGVSETGLALDGAPSYRTRQIAEIGTMCRDCSYKLAARHGYQGPVRLNVTYQPWLPLEKESFMVLRDDQANIVSVASYGYGRAYFEPGEPRTAPCEECGLETLVEA